MKVDNTRKLGEFMERLTRDTKLAIVEKCRSLGETPVCSLYLMASLGSELLGFVEGLGLPLDANHAALREATRAMAAEMKQGDPPRPD